MIENYILKFFVLVTWFIHPGLLKKMYHFQPCEKEEMLLNKKHNGIMIYEENPQTKRWQYFARKRLTVCVTRAGAGGGTPSDWENEKA